MQFLLAAGSQHSRHAGLLDEGDDDRKQGTGHRRMARQRASSVQSVTSVGPSSFILHQWKDESVDAYDRLKAQICQSEEIWFFSKKIRLIHRIQKD